jgi:hypothetical protein
MRASLASAAEYETEKRSALADFVSEIQTEDKEQGKPL